VGGKCQDLQGLNYFGHTQKLSNSDIVRPGTLSKIVRKIIMILGRVPCAKFHRSCLKVDNAQSLTRPKQLTCSQMLTTFVAQFPIIPDHDS
jgi:hypothetical protein